MANENLLGPSQISCQSQATMASGAVRFVDNIRRREELVLIVRYHKWCDEQVEVVIPLHLQWIIGVPRAIVTRRFIMSFNSRFYHGLHVFPEHENAMDIAGRQTTRDPVIISAQESVFNSMFFDMQGLLVSEYDSDDDSVAEFENAVNIEWRRVSRSCKKKEFVDFDESFLFDPIDPYDARLERVRFEVHQELRLYFLSFSETFIFPFAFCDDYDIVIDVLSRYRPPYFSKVVLYANIFSSRELGFRFGDLNFIREYERARFSPLDELTLMEAVLLTSPFADLGDIELNRVYNTPPIYLSEDYLARFDYADDDSIPESESESSETCSCTNSSESDVCLLDQYIVDFRDAVPDDYEQSYVSPIFAPIPPNYYTDLDEEWRTSRPEYLFAQLHDYMQREDLEAERLVDLDASYVSSDITYFMQLINTIPYVAPVQAELRIVEHVEEFIQPFFDLDDDEFNDCVMSDRVIYQWFDTIDKPPPKTTYLHHYCDVEVGSKKLFFGELLTDDEISYRDPVALRDAWDLYRQVDPQQYEILVRLRARDTECAANCNRAVLDHYLKVVASPTSQQIKVRAELEALREAVSNMPSEVELNRLRFNDKYRLDLKSRVSSMMNVKQESLDDFVKLCEDIALSFAICSRSYSLGDIFLGLTTLVKLRLGNKPLFSIDHLESINDFIRGLIDSDFREDYLNNDAPTRLPPQSVAIDTAESILERARYVLDRYHTIHTKPLVKKVMKCIMTVLSRTFTQDDIKEYNASLWSEFFPILEQKVSAPSLIFSIADASVYVLERIVLSIKTGDASQMWAEGTTYQEWFETCQRLQLESKFLNDAERHGIVIHEFYKTLTAMIKRGEILVKTLAKFEYAGATKMLNAMKEISHDRLGYEAGAEMRESPYSVCITGASNNMKTTLANIIHVAFCKANGLPTGAEHIYNRVLGEKHWTGFDSTKITVLYDDLACFLPEHPLAAEQINDLVHLNNNMPFTPPQASLDDKGRTHARNLLTIGSTNTPSLNLKLLFNNPYAFARRFDMYIDVEPKDKYRMEGENWLNMDPSKTAMDTPAVISEYADYWTIRTYSVVPLASNPVNPDRKSVV